MDIDTLTHPPTRGASGTPCPDAPAAALDVAQCAAAGAEAPPGTPDHRRRTAPSRCPTAGAARRAGGAAPGSPRPCPDRSSAADAAWRTRSSRQGTPVGLLPADSLLRKGLGYDLRHVSASGHERPWHGHQPGLPRRGRHRWPSAAPAVTSGRSGVCSMRCTTASGPRSAPARTLFVIGALRPRRSASGASWVVVAVTRRPMAVACPVPAAQKV
jgi:hypothetical protein